MERFDVNKFVDELEYRVAQPEKRKAAVVRAIGEQTRTEVDKLTSHIVDKYLGRHD